MNSKKKIAIVGAGATGTNAALMLDRMGFEVTLLEAAGDILVGGGAATTNIIHSDGFEYHKPDHQTTGEYCIDGAITKALLFPTQAYQTGTCTVDTPIRFFVSKDSENVDGLTRENFARNAEHMRSHFEKQFNALSQRRAGGAAMVEKLLGRNPKTFAHPLQPHEHSECNNIACGYAGSGGGINMPHYYALLKAALAESNISIRFNQNITAIEKQDGHYNVMSNGAAIHADHIIIAAAHQVPDICAKIKNANFRKKEGTSSAEGTYYLNAMTYVKLPKTDNQEKIHQVSRLNFTLQGEGGCMFACIVPPTAREDGYGAIYYPSEKGSQLKKHLYDKNHSASPPVKEWNVYVKNGLPNDHPHVAAIMQQAYRYYPFLRNYAVVDKTLCRTVFNAATPDSHQGLERRVRGIIGADVITDEGHITAFRSPKWTNAELVALIAVDQARQALGEKPLPKSAEHGFGPTHLDIEQITQDLNFRNVKMDVQLAYDYAIQNGLPERLVDPALPVFKQTPARTELLPRDGWSKAANS